MRDALPHSYDAFTFTCEVVGDHDSYESTSHQDVAVRAAARSPKRGESGQAWRAAGESAVSAALRAVLFTARPPALGLHTGARPAKDP